MNNAATTETSNTEKGNTMNTIDLGNNESVSKGITQNNDGTYTAMTYSKSKDFKTLKGAQRWLANRSR
jgi:hypothetical protein